MSNMLYVVHGSTGEYSGRITWPVKAFRKKSKAQEIIVKATMEADRIEKYKRENPNAYWEAEYSSSERTGTILENEYDPEYLMDYTGTSYYMEEVELEEEE